MIYPEFSDGNWPAIPTRVSHDVMRSTRKDGAIDRQYTHRRLEFLCQANGLFEKPKLFTIYDNESFEQSTVLTVPADSREFASKRLFVVVNSETSELGEDGFELRHMTQYAYRWLVNDRRIVRSEDTTAESAAWDTTWNTDGEFGPYIFREDEFVTVTHWEAGRLQIPSNTLGRLSIAGLAELKVAEELIDTVQRLTPAFEDENINLICEEL